MSNIKRLFKPKINRVITGLAIVAIIAVGSYLAYKNGIFASTNSSGAQITVAINNYQIQGSNPAIFNKYTGGRYKCQAVSIWVPGAVQQGSDQATIQFSRDKVSSAVSDIASANRLVATESISSDIQGKTDAQISAYLNTTVIPSSTKASCSGVDSSAYAANLTIPSQYQKPTSSTDTGGTTQTYPLAICVNPSTTDTTRYNSTYDLKGSNYVKRDDTSSAPPTIPVTYYDNPGLYALSIVKGVCSQSTTQDQATTSTTTLCVAYPRGSSTYMTFTYNSSTKAYTDVSGNRKIGLNSISNYTIDPKQCTATSIPSIDTEYTAGDTPCPNNQVKARDISSSDSSEICVPCTSINSSNYPYYVDSTVFAARCPTQYAAGNGPTSTGPSTDTEYTTGGYQVANGDTKCLKVDGNEIQLKRASNLWKPVNPNDSNFSRLFGTGGLTDATLNSWLSNTIHKCATNSDPLTTETTSANNPTAINGNEQNKKVLVPTSGTQAAAVQYPNKINFTAYRVSYAESGQIVPMGGVTFTVKGQSSSRLAGETVSVNYLKAPSSSTTILPHDEAKCSVITETAIKLGLFSVYKNIFTTPDNGATAMFTQAINVAPGYYEVTYSKKPGFSNTTNQKICFQVGKDDGASTPININVLLDAQPGAEPPGLMNTNGIGGVGYDKVNGKDEYRTKILKIPYKYMPDYPWYGWQKDDGTSTYNTGAPVGTTSAGLPVPGIPPNYGTGPNLPQYLSQCQNAGIQLGNIDRSNLPIIGGLIGAFDGIRNNDSLLGILGRTGLGAAIGLGLGSISGNSGINVSINIGQLNAQCQALYNNVIPPQCQSCLGSTPGFNGSPNPSLCPPGCVQQFPALQALLQGNSSIFHF